MRNPLTLPVQSNSEPVHKEQYERLALRDRLTASADHGALARRTGRPELDIVDNPFHDMMRSNRGVL